jgi:hypothetical protein
MSREAEIAKLRAKLISINMAAKVIWTLQRLQLGNFIDEKTNVTIALTSCNRRLLELEDDVEGHNMWLRTVLNGRSERT